MDRPICDRCKDNDFALGDELVVASEAAKGPLSRQEYELLVGPSCLVCRPLVAPSEPPSTERNTTITVEEMHRQQTVAMAARIKAAMRHS